VNALTKIYTNEVRFKILFRKFSTWHKARSEFFHLRTSSKRLKGKDLMMDYV